jgi:dinuclear metal center YbgI/SA1388 family protein
MTGPAISAIAAAIEQWYPTELAADWDQIGLNVGNPSQPINTVLLTVDITEKVLKQAQELGAGLIISHHPVFLPEVSDVVVLQNISRIIHAAAENQIGLYVAHTNADAAIAGVSDAIMSALGAVTESSISVPTQKTGIGRIGSLQKVMQLDDFAKLVAQALPENHFGVTVAGDLAKPITRIAVCGGAGASLLPEVAMLDVDVYVTADLKHHTTLDHLANSEIALVNVSHWASEWLWLATLAKKLNQEFTQVKTIVSEICTDPWVAHYESGSHR